MPNFYTQQERSTWKPITCVPLLGFCSRAIQPCAFQEVSAKHTHGLSQSLALGRGAGSMKGVHVTHGSGSKFLYQCLLDVHLKLCCLARLAVLLAPASQIIQLLPLPLEILQRARRLSQNRDGTGQAMKDKPHVYALLKDCAKGNTASETADYV